MSDIETTNSGKISVKSGGEPWVDVGKSITNASFTSSGSSTSPYANSSGYIGVPISPGESALQRQIDIIQNQMQQMERTMRGMAGQSAEAGRRMTQMYDELKRIYETMADGGDPRIRSLEEAVKAWTDAHDDVLHRETKRLKKLNDILTIGNLPDGLEAAIRDAIELED